MYLGDWFRDRATETAYMEESIRKAFGKLPNRISGKEKRGRIDIGYKTSLYMQMKLPAYSD